MNVEIGAEAALFPEKEYISGIFVAVLRWKIWTEKPSEATVPLRIFAWVREQPLEAGEGGAASSCSPPAPHSPGIWCTGLNNPHNALIQLYLFIPNYLKWVFAVLRAH